MTTTRRAFLQSTSLILAGSCAQRILAAEPGARPAVRAGLLTDVHYADKDPAGTRYYHDSLPKLQAAVAAFNDAKPDFVTHLGDLIDSPPAPDSGNVDRELSHLKTAEAQLAKLACDRHYVLGNHCVFNLTKPEYIENSAAKKPFYSFDHAGFHFVILDACFKADGTAYGRRNFDWRDTVIPPHELTWLSDDLTAATKPTIVFAHQRLDLEDTHVHGVKNASAVRAVLEKSGKVRAVFQGHSHKNDYHPVNQIHYCTLVAMIEGPGPASTGYSIASIFPDGSIKLDGFAHQTSYTWMS
jgi:alkaline phosphatase